MAGTAIAVPFINFLPFEIKIFFSSLQMSDIFFFGVFFDRNSLDMSQGRFVWTFDPFVERFFGSLLQYGHSNFFIQPACSDDGFQSNTAIVVLCRLHKEVCLIFDLVPGEPQYLYSSSSDVEIFGFEQSSKQGLIHLIQSPGYPKSFEKVVFVPGFVSVEIIDPVLKRRQNRFCISPPQFPPRSVPTSEFREFEVIQKNRNGGSIDFRRLDQRPARIGYPGNPAVYMIPQWVPRVVLHMSDQYIVPIPKIQRSIRCKFHIYRTEVFVTYTPDEILAVVAMISGSFIQHSVLFHTQESNGVVDQEVSLNLIRKMPAGDKFETRGRSYLVILFDQIKRFVIGVTVKRNHRAGHHPANSWPGSFGEETLAPVVESDPPGIGDRKLGDAVEFMQLGCVPVKSPVGPSDCTVGSFDIGVEENYFPHINRSGWISGVCTMRMMGIVVIKTTHQYNAGIRPVIPVQIGAELAVATLRNVHPCVGQFKSHRQVTAVRKNDIPVCLPVSIGIFENQ